MRLPEDVLTYILSYLPFNKLDKYLKILGVTQEKIAHIKKNIYNQRFITKTHDDAGLILFEKSLRINGIVILYTIDNIPCRFDGPAIQWGNSAIYMVNGKIHRIGGPAVVIAKHDTDDATVWFYENENDRQRNIYRVLFNGCVGYYLHDEPHRLDGPAIEWSNGDKEWYMHGKRHRIDGPAIEWSNGDKEWYMHGKRHRIDGPAIEMSNGEQEWWLNGQRHRIGGPARIMAWGNEWCQNGELHREDGPARIQFGKMEWYINGKLHRLNGPAVVHPNKKCEYYLNGERQLLMPFKNSYTRYMGSLKGIFKTAK